MRNDNNLPDIDDTQVIDVQIMDTAPSSEVEATRAEIEHTRAEMGETLDAIREKLDPQALMGQARETVSQVTSDVAQQAKEVVASVTEQARVTLHEVTGDVVEQTRTTVHAVVADVTDHAKEVAEHARDAAKEGAKGAVTGAVSGVVDEAKIAGSSLVDVFRQNPLPLSLIGMGLGLLYLNRPRPVAGSYRSTQYRGDHVPDGSGGGDLPEGAPTTSTAQAVGSRVGDVVEQVKDRAGDVVEGVRERASQAAEAVGDAVGTARQKAGDAAGTVASTARGTGSSLVDLVERNPVPAAVTALGAGWLYLNSRNAAGSETQRPVEPWAREYAEQQVRRAGSASFGNEGARTSSSSGSSAGGSGGGFAETLRQNPLPAGIAALGLGTAVGLLVPGTEPEKRALGETRDRLVDKAQQAVGEIKDKAQAVVQETIQTAKQTAAQEARNQGLTPASE